MSFLTGRQAMGLASLATVAMLAACGPTEKPKVAVPPPPPPIVVPLKPYPPLGASPTMTVPPPLPNGNHQTVNTGITTAQTTWNFRSAYNVAALNCLRAEHAAILANYKAFLKNQSKPLTAANKAVDNEFKTRFGPKFIPSRETYMTQVYNFYALPPTLPTFCDAALAVSNEAHALKPAELDAFAARALPRLDAVFETFYRSYDQYRADVTAWETRYGALMAPRTTAAPMPGAVATQ